MAKLTGKQQILRVAVLRDVQRSGGSDRWAHLQSHGHHWMTILACARRGDLTRDGPNWFWLTEAGRAALAKNVEG